LNFVNGQITFAVDELIDKENYNFDMYDPCILNSNDEYLTYYSWLVDCTTSSHVTYQQDAFTLYTPLKNASVTRIGGKEATIKDHRMVEFISTCNGKKYLICLEDVLHVPGQWNNLISLG